MSEPSEILQGTLDLRILRTLELGPMHGLGVSDRIKQITRGVFVVKPGSLFPAWRSFFTNDQAKLERLVPADTITIEAGGGDF